MFLIGVSDFLKEECYTLIIHDNNDRSCIMVYTQKFRSPNSRKGIERWKDLEQLMGTSPMLSMIDKVDQGSEKDFIFKNPLVLQG